MEVVLFEGVFFGFYRNIPVLLQPFQANRTYY